ncbi:MAG: hypothetical protein Q4E36_01140 [Bacillota bacterium]|nr:hypothetical protein [Bacillota bacterium]
MIENLKEFLNANPEISLIFGFIVLVFLVRKVFKEYYKELNDKK